MLHDTGVFVPHSLPPPPAQVSDAENTEYVLLYVYSPSETFEDGLQGVKNIRLGYKDEDSYENDITELGLSYMDYEADYGNPQYQIFVK